MLRVGRTHLKEVLTGAHLSTPFFFFHFFFPQKFTELVRAGVGIPEVSWWFRIAASVFSWGCWTWNVRPLHTPWTHLLQHEWEFRYFFKHVAFLLLALSCFSALFFKKFPWSLCIAWLWGSTSPCVSRSDCDLFLLFWESSFPQSNEFCRSGRTEEDYLWACAYSWVKRVYLFSSQLSLCVRNFTELPALPYYIYKIFVTGCCCLKRGCSWVLRLSIKERSLVCTNQFQMIVSVPLGHEQL